MRRDYCFYNKNASKSCIRNNIDRHWIFRANPELRRLLTPMKGMNFWHESSSGLWRNNTGEKESSGTKEQRLEMSWWKGKKLCADGKSTRIYWRLQLVTIRSRKWWHLISNVSHLEMLQSFHLHRRYAKLSQPRQNQQSMLHLLLGFKPPLKQTRLPTAGPLIVAGEAKKGKTCKLAGRFLRQSHPVILQG